MSFLYSVVSKTTSYVRIFPFSTRKNDAISQCANRLWKLAVIEERRAVSVDNQLRDTSGAGHGREPLEAWLELLGALERCPGPGELSFSARRA